METVAGGPGGFGPLIRHRRVTAGLTQEQLAELSGLSVRAISDIERGRAAPHRSSVELLARALAGRADAEPADAMWDRLHGSAVAGGLVVPRQLPAAAPYFVGRVDELKALTGLVDEPVRPGGSVTVAVISGTAGVGKTALAMHWAYLVADQFTDGQLYVNLRGFDPSRSPVTPAGAVRTLLDALEVSGERIPPSTEAQECLYRSLLAGKRVLIVLDNARDADQVRPLLPGSRGCLVVVTSRNQLAGLAAAEGARQVCLDVLSRADSRELLRLRLGAQRLAREREAVDMLIGLCAQLPLAMSIAAARAAAHPAFPLAVLAAELQHAGSKLDVLDGGDAASNVRAVFSWSCKHLSEPSARMFRLLGVHPGPDISVAAAASVADLGHGQARQILGELARANLLTEHAPSRYAFHDLLRAYAADQASTIDSSADRRTALRRVLDHYLHAARAADRLLYPVRRPITIGACQRGVTLEDGLISHGQALAWFDAEHRALVAAISLAADSGFDTHAWQLPWMLETFFNRRGHRHDWLATQQIALAAAQRLGDQHAQGEARRGVASAQIELGRYDDALGHLTQALRLREETADLRGQARIHLDIARALGHQGRHREAISRGRRAVRLSRAAGSRAKSMQADALNQVGWDLAMLGSYQQTLEFCHQALALYRQVGDKHGEPNALDSLAYAHRYLGHHTEAADCYRRAVELFAELGSRYKKAETLTYAGDAYRAAGDIPAARDAWTRALATFDDLHHPDAEQVRAKLHRLT
jgi:tetratricopeptide (TPR) repeat protein/transcriptional regulator with XRE-family HTH domain